MLVFHEELGRVARLAAAEALEDVSRRIDAERWCLLIVERTVPPHVRPAFLQRDKLSHNLLDTSGLQNLFDGFPWNGHCAKFLAKLRKSVLSTREFVQAHGVQGTSHGKVMITRFLRCKDTLFQENQCEKYTLFQYFLV